MIATAFQLVSLPPLLPDQPQCILWAAHRKTFKSLSHELGGDYTVVWVGKNSSSCTLMSCSFSYWWIIPQFKKERDLRDIWTTAELKQIVITEYLSLLMASITNTERSKLLTVASFHVPPYPPRSLPWGHSGLLLSITNPFYTQDICTCSFCWAFSSPWFLHVWVLLILKVSTQIPPS